MPTTSIPRVDKATHDEIEALKKLVKKVVTEKRVEDYEAIHEPKPKYDPDTIPDKLLGQSYGESVKSLSGKVAKQAFDVGSLFEGGIANVEITREPVRCDNPVQWITWLMPELTLYNWQFEELMRMAGYLTTNKYSPNNRVTITDTNPFLYAGPMANGSGKDLVLIAAFATWFPVIKARNRVIITSASWEQIKSQTEVHIRDLCNRANRKFGMLYKSVQFHHIVPELGSEIKLYVTNEAGRAEGYHPYPGGDMALILNEAKTIPEDLNDATERCTGYSHRIEISSPGPKHGFFHANVTDPHTIQYPAPAELGRYYSRKVTAFDCPHIPASHIERQIYRRGMDSPWVQSSIFANFSDLDSPVVITEYEYNTCDKANITQKGDDIGIGLDIAAGGDEDACFVRRGNTIIHHFFFRQHNLELAASLIDTQLMPWKHLQYKFRADNGGVGMGCIDNLNKLGWRIIRTNNQSPSYNKREFLNLGAESWHHVKRLIARQDIPLPKGIDKLKVQLTNRYWRGLDSTQGKLALESKQEAKAGGRPSPDRADAYVLCYFSYRPKLVVQAVVKPADQNLVTADTLMRMMYAGKLFPNQTKQRGRFTLLNGRI